jgi:predicted Rossmann fold flavoprotein
MQSILEQTVSMESRAASSEVAIVGAGAAGLATAIFARRLSPDQPVLLLEGAKKPGAKILVSGGGRCNITNARVTEADFWGGRGTIVRQVLRALPVADTIEFFRELGVPLHEERDGKLFPDSNRARDIVDALLREAARAGVVMLTDHRVLDVAGSRGSFILQTNHGPITAGAVVLATGGQSLPKSGSDGAGYRIAQQFGHTIVAPIPALAPLRLTDVTGALHKRLSGVSHDAELTVRADGIAATRLTGALLWTHFGVSGPVALNASRHWARAALEERGPTITVNFCPGTRFEDVDARLIAAARERPRASVQTILAGWLPASVAAALADDLGLSEVPLAQRPREDRRRLTHALVEWQLPVEDTRGYNYAEATAGGVALTEIDPSTMESRVNAGLFLVGELLDVDGRIGGYNFQWAWSSARAAARGLGAMRGLPSQARKPANGANGDRYDDNQN